MSAHSLSQLIDRALAGEEIVVTRHGQPVVVPKPVAKPVCAVSAADVDWLAQRRIADPEAAAVAVKPTPRLFVADPILLPCLSRGSGLS